eukprot:SAG31_NODE_399_length_16247_cov_19.137540_11_plen_526_part_00
MILLGKVSCSDVRFLCRLSRYAVDKKGVDEVFAQLDTDSSNSLDLHECQMAAAILGGVLLNAEALKQEVAKHDSDGDGMLSFEEFKVWWGKQNAASSEASIETKKLDETSGADVILTPTTKEASSKEPEPERVGGIIVRSGKWGVVQRKTLKRFRIEDDMSVGVDDLSKAESLEACRRAGIIIRDETSVSAEALRTALLSQFNDLPMSLQDVFDKYDIDNSGSLDKEEVSHAAAMLGLVIGTNDIDRTFAEMDTDGDGTISFSEFNAWWLTEKTRRTPEFWAVRSYSYRESSTSLETADLSIREVQKLAHTGVITGSTLIWSDEFAKFISFSDCKKIRELNIALENNYCEKLVYRHDSGTSSEPISTDEALVMLHSGILTEDTEVMTASDNHLVSNSDILDAVRSMVNKCETWTPLSDVKHLFGFAEYIPLDLDSGGVDVEEELGKFTLMIVCKLCRQAAIAPRVLSIHCGRRVGLGSPRSPQVKAGFAQDLNNMFATTAWQGGVVRIHHQHRTNMSPSNKGSVL